MHPSASKPCLVVVQGRGVHDLSVHRACRVGVWNAMDVVRGMKSMRENMIYVSGVFHI